MHAKQALQRNVPDRPDIYDLQLRKVLMSNRQYAALRMFIESNSIKTQEALQIDQRSLGSLFHRGYIKFTANTFQVTSLGKQAMSIFETTVVIKERPGQFFSTYIRTVNALKHYQREPK